jgi:hypothetical protein
MGGNFSVFSPGANFRGDDVRHEMSGNWFARNTKVSLATFTSLGNL